MTRIDHPYRGLTGGRWLRGNLHSHTTRSDGQSTPQQLIDHYAGRGYDFLAVTDHDIYTGAKEHRGWDRRRMVLLPGNEVTANGPHIVHVGPGGYVKPDRLRQNAINRIASGSGLAIIAHPNWTDDFDGTPIAKMTEWIGYHGVEVFNGVIGRLPGSRYASNKWDVLLSQGRRIWGFANDDTHADIDVACGWNVVYARRRSAAAILEALALGRFYPSTGVVIRRVGVRGMRIRIETENAVRIVAVGDAGRRITYVDGPTIEVEAPANATYIRFECWGQGEQFAWTQPFFVRKARAAG